MKTSKLVVDMLRKRQDRIELLEQLLTNSEAQVAHLMKQRKMLREQVSELREFVDKVAAGDEPALAVEADLILTEVMG